MKYLIFIFLVIVFACKQSNIKEDFYANGNLKSKMEIGANGLPNGIYEEYYDSGEVKVKTNYESGTNNDTIYVYFKNGTLKEKGVMHNNSRIGWWTIYNDKGREKERIEYKMLENGSYKNQSIRYDKNGKIVDSLSSFYQIDLPDTLQLGKNIGYLKYNSNFKLDTKYLYVVVDNHYSDLEVKKDTFINEVDGTPFGVYFYKKGMNVIKGTTIEQLLYEEKINQDSSKLRIEEHKKYFELEVYVKDSI